MKRRIKEYFKFFVLYFTVIILVFMAGCIGTSSTTPIINSFLANPSIITVGESSTLSWNVTDAASVTIDQSVGSVASTGTTAVSPATTTTYILTATNAAGSVTAITTITVNPVAPTTPIINSFSANPPSITEGESSTLSWNVSNATSVSIDHGIGSVALISSTTVSPTTTTTYTLTATNVAGSVTASVTITVGLAYGSIDINSTPTGAKVYLDGVDTGSVTPYVITHVEAGIHTVKLDKYLYKVQEDVNVSVSAGETTYLNWALILASPLTITLQPGSEGKDAGVETVNPLSNYENLNFFAAGNNWIPNVLRSYIQFDLSSVPNNAIITDADLKLYHYSSWGSDAFTIGLYKVTESWLENIITWNDQPTSSSDAEFLCSIPAGSINFWRSWDIDTLVQGWLDGTITNYGMLLMDTDEILVQTAALLYTSDYTINITMRPKLEIDYYIP